MTDHLTARNNAKARNLVVLIDGTWVSPVRRRIGQQQSNVFWLNLFLEAQSSNGEAQIAFYHPGIGAAASNAERWLGGGLALGLERFVEAVYLDIVANFDGGETDEESRHENTKRKSDKLYIIGFSRGAVIASIVASLVSRFGILKPNFIDFYRQLWRHEKGEKLNADAEVIRKQCCREAKVEFLGLFDTVPGAWAEGYSPENRVMRERFFQNRKLPLNVKRALHILSMDEGRRAYRNIAFDGVEDATKQTLEQIWMPGVHSDIGGGYGQDFLSNISLLTMIDRLKTAGLKLDNNRLEPLKQNIRVQFPKRDGIYIHDEFGGSVARRLISQIYSGLARAGGLIGTERRRASSGDYYHELCRRIEDRFVRMKSLEESAIFHLSYYRNQGWPAMPFAEVGLLHECLDDMPDRPARGHSGSFVRPPRPPYNDKIGRRAGSARNSFNRRRIMHRKFFALALCAGLGLAGFAVPPAQAAMSPIKAFDTDNDGTLDLAEVQNAAGSMFGKLEKDNDGTLDRKEVGARIGKKEFAEADPDDDKTLSKDEYLALAASLFKEADTDNEGTLDAKELKSKPGKALVRLLR